MSSATLTDTAGRTRRAASRGPRRRPPPSPSSDASSLRPWHFFLIATLTLATVSVILMRHASAPAIVLVALTVCAAGYTAYTLFRTLLPLTGAGVSDDAVMVGGRTRAALERDKALALRSIKELEFDHAMGKVADADFAEMSGRLRARALRLMRQLEGADAYRNAIERDLAARVSPEPAERAAAVARGPSRGARVLLHAVRRGRRGRRALLPDVRHAPPRPRRSAVVIRRAAIVCVALVAAAVGVTGTAFAQMPDPRAMSGMSMPSPNLPDGTITVRIVRGQITNNLPGVTVELHGAGDVRTVKTGADGRALFAGCRPAPR